MIVIKFVYPVSHCVSGGDKDRATERRVPVILDARPSQTRRASLQGEGCVVPRVPAGDPGGGDTGGDVFPAGGRGIQRRVRGGGGDDGRDTGQIRRNIQVYLYPQILSYMT